MIGMRAEKVDPLLLLILWLGVLQWYTLANVGLALKPVHIPYFLAAASGYLHMARSAALGDAALPMRRLMAVAFPLGFLAYVALMFLSVFWAPDLADATRQVGKIVIYALGCLGLFFHVRALPQQVLLRTGAWGCALAGASFVAVAWFTLKSRGISLPTTILQAIQTGNPRLLQFQIFLNLFNTPEALAEGETTVVSLRHDICSYLYISFLLAIGAAFSPRFRPALRWLSAAAAVFAVLIVLTAVSRAVIIVMAMALSVLLFSLVLRRSLIAIALAIGVATIVFWLVASGEFERLSGLYTIFEQRFGAFTEDARIEMYARALDLINDRPIFGYGASFRTDFGEGRPLTVHNLFLGAWLQAGLLALIAALVWYWSLFTAWADWVLRVFADTPRLTIALLLILPLFRSMISGDGGNFTMPEWIALTVAVSARLGRGDLPVQESLETSAA